METETLPLGDRDWRLTELHGQPAVPSEDSSRDAMLHFEADSGRVYGSSGCNRLTGPYTSSGDTLTFGALASTRMACMDERVNQQENEFLAALGSTRSYRMSGDTLILVGESGPLARLVASPGA